MERETIEKNTILRVLVGSQAYGISSGEGSDRDEKGVCIEPFEKAVGLSGFEQFEYRSAAERTGNRFEPSGPGDLDLTIYSLRKFIKLALKGNPTIIEMLFIKDYLKGTCSLGMSLQELHTKILSRHVAGPYLGYMQAQRRKLTEKVQEEGTERWHLVQKYGFDTKYAGHLIRLGLQAVELLSTGKLTIPMKPEDVTLVRGIRAGSFPLDMVLASSNDLETQIKYWMDHSDLPKQPDFKAVERWMVNTYWNYWKAQRLMLDLPMNNMIQ